MAMTFDPAEYRMTVGEHLEELRRRLILALGGFVVVFVICLIFGDRVLMFFCRPLYIVLEERGLSSSLKTDTLPEGFATWIRVNVITAIALSSPWLIYQLWSFVAAGLYPTERKAVTRYMPLSIGLLVSGMAMVYFLVLPWTIRFFVDFTASVPVPTQHVTTTQPYVPMIVPVLRGDPVSPGEGEIWIDATNFRLKLKHDGQVRSIRLAVDSLITPEQKVGDYINMFVAMLLTFGLCFQLPLVVLALIRVGIVEMDTMKASRRYVYFGMAVVAAVITPGDAITATIALMIPLMLLYELGIVLAQWGQPRRKVDASE